MTIKPRRPPPICRMILQKRKERGDTRNALAIRLGVSPVTVRNWEEMGMVPRSMHLIDPLAEYLGLDAQEVEAMCSRERRKRLIAGMRRHA